MGAVELHDLAGELARERRHSRDLERAGGDDDLVGMQLAVREFDAVAAVFGVHRGDATLELDGQLEVAGVAGEVADDLVARGVAIRVAGKGEAGEAVVARGREQPQRVPARAPGRGAASRMVNRRSCRARWWPTARPAWPPPMTITS
jgi:hypothetical protein